MQADIAKLRPHQVTAAENLLRLLRNQNAVDLSDTGTGKTYVAAFIAKQLGVPTIAVVPKISKTAWHRAAAHFGDTISVVGYEELRMGRSGFGKWDNNPPPGFKNERWFKCQCCQLPVDFENFQGCYVHPLKIHCIEEKKKTWKYGAFRFSPEVKFIIFDEVHRASGIKSRNADMLIAARRQGIQTLGLSATAACTPLQMRALGYSLGLHDLEGFYGWSRKYGCGKLDGIPGWHWLAGKDKQVEYMQKLHHELIPEHGVRVRVNEIPGFPKRTITVEQFDLDEAGKIQHYYNEMASPLATLKARAFRDAAPDGPLTKHLRIKQEIELLKVPLAVELAQDYIEKGMSVGIFINFSATMQELKRRLNCDCFIDGSPAGQKFRDRSMERFTADTARLILLNSEAGGICVNLQDLRGEFPRMGLVMPPLSARSFKQLVGRFHREGALTPCFYKVLLAAGTAEVKMFEKLSGKLDNLDSLNDGDFEAV